MSSVKSSSNSTSKSSSKSSSKLSTKKAYNNYIFDDDAVKELDGRWYSDYTKVDRATVFAVMDLSTRLILGYKIYFKPHPSLVLEISSDLSVLGDASKDFIHLVKSIITDRSISPTFFYFDRCCTDISNDFQQFLKSRQIVQSFAVEIDFGNQVIERWNRTFKSLLRTK